MNRRTALLYLFCGFISLEPLWSDTPNLAAAPSSSPIPMSSSADTGSNSVTQEQMWNLHGQNTDIYQYNPGFPAQYTGPYSLIGTPQVEETVSADIMLGLRLWQGAQFHVDGMMFQGFGLSNVHGVAAFPSGEAFKVGTWSPEFIMPRCFVSQVFGFGGPKEAIADDQTHLAGMEDISRLTVTVGKMSVYDIFDVNTYADSPRTQFMNWAFMANAAWDAPQDADGFITGIAFDFNQRDWALRYGFFQVPDVLNSLYEDTNFTQAWSQVIEAERRFSINDHPGKVHFLAFLERAHMGYYQDAIDNAPQNGGTPNIATSAYNLKYGLGINAEQEIVKDVGIFSRLGWGNGQTENWGYTDCDWTATLGLSVTGSYWNRSNDTFGTAFAIDGLSPVHAAYFNAGGTGLVLGDGALNYATEQVSETYYSFQVTKGVALTLDYQFINNPGYNCVRGPVNVLGARAHFEF